MKAELVMDALTMIWLRRRPAPDALCHSYRGSWYAGLELRHKLAAHGMRTR